MLLTRQFPCQGLPKPSNVVAYPVSSACSGLGSTGMFFTHCSRVKEKEWNKMGIKQVFIPYIIGYVPSYWCFSLSNCTCSAFDPTVLLNLKEVSMAEEGRLCS